MGLIRTIALAILGFSSFVFVVLFGRLPFFRYGTIATAMYIALSDEPRKTPIGFIYRLVWIHVPNGISYLDSRLFGGRVIGLWNRAGSYVLYENHPLVLVFFTTMLASGELIFIPSAWPRVSVIHHVCITVAVGLPYYFLYASVVTKSFITADNHAEEMGRYPYDKVIFHPGHTCETCLFLKPARSKHCSYCKGCVSRQDHHCVWLTNCVGLNNYRYFLSLLLSLSVMLTYGALLGYSLLAQTLDDLVPPSSPARTRKQSWPTFFNLCTGIIAYDTRIGAVTMLMFMTAPLAVGFLVYHTYLIWAGMTTNESAKWSDWKDDVADGMAFKFVGSHKRSKSPLLDSPQAEISWPVSSDQMLVLTGGEPPKEGHGVHRSSNDIMQPHDPKAAIDQRFVQVKSMKEIDNIYDLGFWNNLCHVFEARSAQKSHRT